MALCRTFLSLIVCTLLTGLAVGLPGSAYAADPVRGEQLFMTAPRTGLLACADCHSDNPQQNNFGSIWSGRNAVSLIQRAVQNNTGGMGYFQSFYNATDLADIAAFLGNAPARLQFGNTPVGSTSAAQSIDIASSLKLGLGGLVLSTEGDFVITSSTCDAELPRFSQCSVALAFRPTEEGTRTGVLVVTHVLSPTPVRVPLTGVAPAVPRAVASLLPTSLDLGVVPLHALGAARHASLANNSLDPLRITSLSTTAQDLVLSGGSCVAGHVLLRGQQCLVVLRFAPRSGGLQRGQLRVLHDGVGGVSTVDLTGLAAPAVAEQLRADRVAIDFGITLPGQRGAEQVLVWTQQGKDTLAAVPVAISDERFVITRNNCTGAVAAWQRCELGIVFAPNRAVASSATLRVGQALTVPLSGVGSGSGELSALPRRGLLSSAPGQVLESIFTVKNRGVAALRLQGLTLAGPQAADFSLDGLGSCRVDTLLAPGASCQIVLRFFSSTLGQRQAQLLVDVQGAAVPLTIDLTAQVSTASPVLAVDALKWDAGAVAVGSLREQDVVVRNLGAAPLAWATIGIAGDSNAGFTARGGCLGAGVSTGAGGNVAVGTRAPPLPPSASCSLTLRWLPTTPEASQASLVLWPEGALRPLLVSLQGQARPAGTPSSWPASVLRTPVGSLAAAELVVEPGTLVFEALVTASGTGAAGASRSQSLVLSNGGNQPLLLGAPSSSSAAFVLNSDACAWGTQLLLPGESCAARLDWAGGSTAAGRLRFATDVAEVEAFAAITVSEDPAQRSNVGAGGGALAGPATWLGLPALVVAAWALRRRPVPHTAVKARRESSHD